MSQYFPPYFNTYGYTRDIKVKIDLNEYAKKDDLKKITHTDISNLATKTELSNEVNKLNNKIPDICNLATKTELKNKISNISNLAAKASLVKIASDINKKVDHSTDFVKVLNQLKFFKGSMFFSKNGLENVLVF